MNKLLILGLILSFNLLPAQMQNEQSNDKKNNSNQISTYQKTITLLNDAVRSAPNNADLYCLLAHYYEMDNQVIKAVSAWESCKNYSVDDKIIKEANHHIKRLKEIDR